jgi:hypothetical protein
MYISVIMVKFKSPALKLDPKKKNHSTQDSRVVPHRGTNWAALWLTAQIRRDAVLSESYGRGHHTTFPTDFMHLKSQKKTQKSRNNYGYPV